MTNLLENAQTSFDAISDQVSRVQCSCPERDYLQRSAHAKAQTLHNSAAELKTAISSTSKEEVAGVSL